MTSKEIRDQFFDFFKEKNHKIISSAPVIPFDDPTLLFTNAGMNQFKDVFLGKGTRDYTRAADTQKCIRVSGKHNDLEEVGHDTYHHTFFEMLGNWSFGDYYKAEAITWAWELLTEVWKLPKERLFATVFRTDDEAFEIWKTKTDIDNSHILRFDEKDNFWEMGEVGPCGPSSEIHINLSNDYNGASLVNAGDAKCIELWNLVFVQYNRDKSGKLHELPLKHIDTGMGFERICAVLQNKTSNYDTDIFVPLLNEISELSKIKYENEEHQIAMRVIADHIRTLTFAIAEGAVPGNEGRSYVLRRILRRAARYGRKLNLNKPFLYKLVDAVVNKAAGGMGLVFPEIKDNQKTVEKIIKAEEESFNVTLDRGISLFEDLIAKAGSNKIISGQDIFKLYDTFGFPVDLVEVMAKEKGFSLDISNFNELMNQQKERARKSTKNKIASLNNVVSDLSDFEIEENADTNFVGYEKLETATKIVGVKSEENTSLLLLKETPFYFESGGQTNDTGILIVDNNNFNIIDLSKIDNRLVHVVENKTQFDFKIGMDINAVVNKNRRWAIMRNHSATHILNAALRHILGTHVKQAGSFVGQDRLRFDFTHFAKLSKEELRDIELLVNSKLLDNLKLYHHKNIPFEEAKKMGALMFFGDKYGDKVNVVQFGDFSMEFCGGTHVRNSSQIGLFKIISEGSVASGVRRIEAVTGLGVEKYINEQIIKLSDAADKIAQLNDEKKYLEKQLSEFSFKEKLKALELILQSPKEIGGISIYSSKVDAGNMDELKSLADELRNRIKSGIGVLIAEINKKVNIVCIVTDDLIKGKKLSAGKIVGDAAKIVGGGGGGKQHLATAGGKDVGKINDVLSGTVDIVSKYL